MPVELVDMRQELTHGIVRWWEHREVSIGYSITYETIFKASRPHIWIPKLTVPQSIALGVGAAIIKNPEVTRRFWVGWGK